MGASRRRQSGADQGQQSVFEQPDHLERGVAGGDAEGLFDRIATVGQRSDLTLAEPAQHERAHLLIDQRQQLLVQGGRGRAFDDFGAQGTELQPMLRRQAGAG